MGYSLQGNRKTMEEKSILTAMRSSSIINARVGQEMRAARPVISVDTKKKELVGQFKNRARMAAERGPDEVNVHDFFDPVKGKGDPLRGVRLGRNEGWVSVGIDHDTAEFAVASIRRWWSGWARTLPDRPELLITADGGGSNGYRNRLWKACSRLGRRLNMTLNVRHLPPGTSKWNKIEHRMFCHITQNWRGRPLEDLLTIVSLIASTSTNKGLKIEAELDMNQYDNGKKIDEREMAKLGIILIRFSWRMELRVFAII